MAGLRIGDRVTLDGQAFYVRGFSPMSAATRRVYVEDVETGETMEAVADDLRAATPNDPRDIQAPGQ